MFSLQNKRARGLVREVPASRTVRFSDFFHPGRSYMWAPRWLPIHSMRQNCTLILTLRSWCRSSSFLSLSLGTCVPLLIDLGTRDAWKVRFWEVLLLFWCQRCDFYLLFFQWIWWSDEVDLILFEWHSFPIKGWIFYLFLSFFVYFWDLDLLTCW